MVIYGLCGITGLQGYQECTSIQDISIRTGGEGGNQSILGITQLVVEARVA